MKKYLMAANWKMYKNLEEAINFANKIKNVNIPDNVEVLICPTYPLIYPVYLQLKDTEIKVGAQNVYFQLEGAYTGEVSVYSLKSIGVSYVIVGHSERRKYFNETDDFLNKKLRTVIENGLKPILCVGEVIEQRKQGKTMQVVQSQLDGALEGFAAEEIKDLVIAYEPVWAIGTGLTATPEQAQEVHAFIREYLKNRFGATIAEGIRIQYGGSVKPENVKSLMSQADVDGALVGGASLDPEKFDKIINFEKQ